MTGRPGGERGTVSIEAAIVLSSLIVGYFALMIVAGRIMSQENDVRSAAHAAARAASLRDTFEQASADVDAIVATNLSDSGVSCEDQQAVIVSGPGDFAPGGFVTVEVRCLARSLRVLGLPDNLYWYRATEVIDEYRGEP